MSKPEFKAQSVRGTQDFLPEQSILYRGIEALSLQVARRFGYQEIITPIFEFADVFHRSLGETSDAVSKETYDFQDRGGDTLTLRPEGTAGVVRAFISNGMAQHLPLKLSYAGPMFRYERPQKGRYRQFHQIGVEALGFDDPWADVECISLAWEILRELGLSDKVQLEINSLGDKESRAQHREALVNYLRPLSARLSHDSQLRLEKNPLRILDSKDPGDREILKGAPALHDHWNENSRAFYQGVLSGLQSLGIPVVENANLVRGFDYYTHTVFEITTEHLGAQSAVISGGRYDGLIEQMGGPATKGVGWGAGLERLMLLVDPARLQAPTRLVTILSADPTAELICQKLAFELRQQGFTVELLLSGQMGKKMKRANKLGAVFAVIIGQTELDNKQVTVKNLQSGEQKTFATAELKDHLSR
jgi:histidyl-tRNA synthetase